MADESGPLPNGQPVPAAVVCVAAAGISARPARSSTLTRALLERDLRQFRALTRGMSPLSVAESYDGLVLAFGTAREAVRFAVRVQESVHDNVRRFPPEQRLEHKLGVHTGDVDLKPDGVHGETVTVALRLMSEAPPGTIWISQAVYEVVRRKLDVPSRYLGLQRLADVPDPIPVYALTVEPHQASLQVWLRRNWRVVLGTAGAAAFAGCNLALLSVAFRIDTDSDDMPVTLVVAATPLPLAGGPGPLAAPTPGGAAMPIPMPGVVQPTPVPPTTLIGLQTFEDTPGNQPPTEPFRMPVLPGVSVRVSDQHHSPFSRGSHALLIERNAAATLPTDAVATELSWPRENVAVIARFDLLVPGDSGPLLPGIAVVDSADAGNTLELTFTGRQLTIQHAGGSAVLGQLPADTWHRIEVLPELRDSQAYAVVELTRWDAAQQAASANERTVVPLARQAIPAFDRIQFGWPATLTTQPADSQPAATTTSAPATSPSANAGGSAEPTSQPSAAATLQAVAATAAVTPADSQPAEAQPADTQPATQPSSATATEPAPTATPSAIPTATPVPPRNAVLIIDNLEVRRMP